jgi:hypothetical protein
MSTSSIQRFVGWLNADTIFLRSCMFIAGSCIFIGLAWGIFREWPIQESWIWFFLAPLGTFGLALMTVPLLASDQKFERYLDLMADGGDMPVILFFVVVMFAAIPLTMVIRFVKKGLK